MLGIVFLWYHVRKTEHEKGESDEMDDACKVKPFTDIYLHFPQGSLAGMGEGGSLALPSARRLN